MTNKPLLLTLLGLLIGHFSFAQCEYQFQPDPEQGLDATCFRTPICEINGNARPCDTTNRAQSPHLYMSSLSFGGVREQKRAFLKFDFDQIGKVSSKCLPSKATLNLYYYQNAATNDEHRGDNAFYIERVTQDWLEDTIRWMYPASSFNLRMPETTTRGRILVPASSSKTSNYTIDISDMVKFWFENPDSNFGVRLILQNENFVDTGTQVHLASSDYPDPKLRPMVSVTFPCMEADLGPDRFICIGDKAELEANGGAEYEWFALGTGNDALSNTTAKRPSITPSVLKQSFYIVSKIGSCADNDTIEITSEAPGTARIISPLTKPYVLCRGDSVELKADGGTIYQWEPSAGLANPNTFTTWAKPDTSTTYLVKVSNPGDKCPGKDFIRIEINNQLRTELNIDSATICKGDSVLLEATTTATDFNWTPQNGLVNNKAASTYAKPDVTTKYVLESSAAGSCSDFDTVLVRVTQAAVVDAGKDTTICEGETVILKGSGDGTFVWNNAETLDDAFLKNPKATPTTTTTYQLTVDGSGQCDGTDEVTLTVVEKPTLNVNVTDTFLCIFGDGGNGDQLVLEATNSTNVKWSTGEETSIIQFIPTVVGDAIIKVVGNEELNGIVCYSDTTEIKIAVDNCEKSEKISPPKFFSPNGDMINDTWEIPELTRFTENELQIYNRWGELIFQKENYANNWDGTYSGQELPEDTYIWIIELTFRGESETYQGTVTIVRDQDSK
ncbi:MAG: gliding motility-associated C-terminal domain-containing protein [Bacteroidetes bacterium]|nr:gliding motility-associated C-terminal domain-containing protein [Bacteroidota bacterium]